MGKNHDSARAAATIGVLNLDRLSAHHGIFTKPVPQAAFQLVPITVSTVVAPAGRGCLPAPRTLLLHTWLDSSKSTAPGAIGARMAGRGGSSWQHPALVVAPVLNDTRILAQSTREYTGHWPLRSRGQQIGPAGGRRVGRGAPGGAAGRARLELR